MYQQHIETISELKIISSLTKKINEMKNVLNELVQTQPDLSQLNLIFKSLECITQFNLKEKVKTKSDKVLFVKNCEKTFNAILIFCRAMTNKNLKKESKELEAKLFDVVFSPNEEEKSTRIFSVYDMHDTFLGSKKPFLNFKSSTGSGKTRCAPFFFAIKSIEDKKNRKFFMMTQPSTSLIKDKMKDFKNIMGDSVILVSDINEMINLYKDPPKKPVVGLFSPNTALRLLKQCDRSRLNIVKQTRFCLDEIHERSVETDILIALLTERTSEKEDQFSLQVLMMSATPDSRVLKCFGQPVEMLELPDSQLFPIEDIHRKAKTFNDVQSQALELTFSVIERMAKREVEPGHILIFTSGNQRINYLISSITSQLDSKLGTQNVQVIKNLNVYLDDKKIFYNKLEEYLELKGNTEDENPDSTNIDNDETKIGDDENNSNKNDTLFFIPMKFAGFIKEEAKEIAKNPIPNHPNVIKIIVATNAIESSITIDGLACVVDCGVQNKGEYNKDSGLTFLTECAISKQSQVQRRGRVGRVRKGICAQITINGNPPKEFLEPQILTSDISSNILNLRRIGINLEEVGNLPDPVPEEKMEAVLNELISINALDPVTERLTDVGRKLSYFPSMSPFLASAILSVSNESEEDHNILSLLSSLIVLIFSTQNICNNPYALQLQKNFNEDSDIITLVRTFLDVMVSKEGNKASTKKAVFFKYGFNEKSAVQITGTICTIMGNIYYEEIFKEKDVWQKIDDLYRKLEEKNLLMNHIQSLITHIGQIKGKWIECRRAKFLAVCNVLQRHNYIYEGDKSLNNKEPDKNAEITIANCRPGGCGFSIPGAAFIMQINHNNDNNKNYGDIVHRDISNKTNIPHPTSIIGESYLNNIFSVPLIDSYIGKDGNYIAFHKRMYFGGKNKDEDLKFMPKSFLDKTAISFIPKDEKSLEMVKEAIAKIKNLVPFTPRCVIVHNDSIKSAVAVISNGTDKYLSETIFYNENNYIPFKIDKQMIEYLLQNKEKLNSITGDLLIAVTGENYTFSTDSPEEDPLGDIKIPSTALKESCVFSKKSFLQNHLIVLSRKSIPNGQQMSWIDQTISIEYVKEDVNVHTANSNIGGIGRVSHFCDSFFLMPKNPSLNIKGNYPTQNGNMNDPGINHSNKGIIGQMFDRYASNCIQGNNLIKKVELENFSINQDSYTQQIQSSTQCLRLINSETNINHLTNLVNELADVKTTQAIKFANKEFKVLSQLKARRQSLENEILSITTKKDVSKGGSFDIKTLLAGREMMSYILPLRNYEIEFENFEKTTPLVKLRKTEHIKSVTDSLMSIPYCYTEKIPICQIIVYHRKDLNLSKDEFLRKINEVCSKFGRVVYKEPKYYESQGNPTQKGSAAILIFTVDFVIPFVGEIEEAFTGKALSALQIPSNIIPTSVVSNPVVKDIIKKWLKENNFNEIFERGSRWFGPQSEIAKASTLISKKQSLPKIPFKIFMVPGGVNIDIVQNDLKRSRNNTWILDKVARKIIVLDDVENEKVQIFLSKYLNNKKAADDQHQEIEPVLGDNIFFCENEAILSGNQISIYHKDGSTTMRNFCVTCVHSLLQEAVGTMFDFEENTPVFRRIAENNENIKMLSLVECEEMRNGNGDVQVWPEIPLGQLMWSLVCEPMLCSLAKTWFTAIMAQALHSSQKTTYCPCHSAIVFRHPGNSIGIKCSDSSCRMYLCGNCSQWHLPGQCKVELNAKEIPKGFRICPNCKNVVYKLEACNHITCNCGKHFCYYCGAGPWDDGGSVYAHLNKEHEGCYNDPPDYKKFCLSDNSVSDQELRTFYEKYPQYQ